MLFSPPLMGRHDMGKQHPDWVAWCIAALFFVVIAVEACWIVDARADLATCQAIVEWGR